MSLSNGDHIGNLRRHRANRQGRKWARCIAPSTAPCRVLEQALAFTGGTQDGPRFRLFWLLLAPHFFLGGRNLLSIEATIT